MTSTPVTPTAPTGASGSTPAATTAARAARRRAVERRGLEQILVGALGLVAAIGLWFWGILVVLQVGIGIVLPRVLDDEEAGIQISAGPVGPVQVFLFVMGIVTAAGLLTVHVAAGGTRRSAWRGWLLAAPVVGVSFAVVGLGVTALSRAVATASGPDGASLPGAFEAAVPTACGLAILGTTAYLTGIAVNVTYRRLGGGLGTLALPLVGAPVILAHVVLMGGGSGDGGVGDVPGVATSVVGWAAAVGCAVVAGVLVALVVRRTPIA
ncbi:hypothetical protein [Litorihabitans aurantiacus]|uniref:Uncharacterized protein n=1 Tax=Litorihabitans aurantiacus TaxID=1930061 RepID=A0AA37XF20_9MICO|nr:hypothetical protein [Litorihabitans aurantiacus]GMA32011.1 hypothetical protein GCM10025875_20030 [Litorihabitans aurantiacus]